MVEGHERGRIRRRNSVCIGGVGYDDGGNRRIGFSLLGDAQICRVTSGSIEHEEATYLC